MFTKKHVVLIAEVIKKESDPHVRVRLCNQFCKLFEANSERFDWELFRAACDVYPDIFKNTRKPGESYVA